MPRPTIVRHSDRHNDLMGIREEPERARQRLAILTLLRDAAERRRDVVEAVWNSSDDADAMRRLREVVDIPHGVSPEVILDMQIRKMTGEARNELDAAIGELRTLVQGSFE